MNVRDDDLRIRSGRIRNRGSQLKTFIAQVLKAAQKAGHAGRRSAWSRAGQRRASTFGRGRGIAFASTHLLDPSRRVLVKARVVRHRGRASRSAPLSAHIAYLKREGVTKGSDKARMFDADTDRAEERGFAERCRGDRHHFRFIVSPEDAGEMTDLKAFARDLVVDMERDLATRLDWIAVEHWNTDNPHVHLLVRGKADDGQDLVISRDYISRGMRARAEELVTLELGPKSECTVRSALKREVDAERWTRLDRAIRREADETGFVDLRPQNTGQADPEIRRLMVGRLQRLGRMGLAANAGPAQWVIALDTERTLREFGIRGDIIKTMHRAMMESGIERGFDAYVIHDRCTAPPIIGRLVTKGLHDELTGEAYVVIDGVDGHAHHVRFPDLQMLEHSPPAGGIVELRRLEAEGETQSRLVLAVRSDLPIEAQVGASGATWLDYRLVVRESATLSDIGFGREVRQALEARIEHLAVDGLARRQGQRVVFARDLLATLRRRELDAAAAKITSETGLAHHPLAEGDAVTGTYRQRIILASGRVAMIDDGLGFQLVRWQPSLDRHLGRQVSGIIGLGNRIDWTFTRKRGLGL
jgi:type IV secretory pathway VirD2 relaxase